MIAQRRTRSARQVLVDGAQAVPHLPVDVRALDCDFYVFSSHKIYRPDGRRRALWRARLYWRPCRPIQGGGDMIASVTFEKTTYNQAAVQVRGRHAQHRRCRRSAARRSDFLSGLGSRGGRSRTRTPARATHRDSDDGSQACASSARRSTRLACCRSSTGGHPPARHRHAILDQRGRGSIRHRAALSRSRSWIRFGLSRQRRAHRSRSTTRAKRSMSWRRRTSRHGGNGVISNEQAPSHPRSQSEPRGTSRDRARGSDQSYSRSAANRLTLFVNWLSAHHRRGCSRDRAAHLEASARR